MLQIENPSTATTNAADEAVFVIARGAANGQPSGEFPTGAAKGVLTRRRHVGQGIWAQIDRDYATYVPPGYDAQGPARLMLFQDMRLYLSDRFNLPALFDQLIASGDIPPLVAVFVEPGDLPHETPNTRGNRSLEYDSVNDAYVRFLLDELLPEALEGLNISSDPAHRAICGMSSGGICAFNAAWHRPDAFGKVISHVGSFTDIRGGNVYPAWVRKNGPKPIRVFLQGGANDLDNTMGSWAVANHDMAAALKFRGYDYRFEFGPGAHDLRHAAAIFPQTLRWIWR